MWSVSGMSEEKLHFCKIVSVQVSLASLKKLKSLIES